ncbi:cobalt-precorrin-6x reductase [Gloeomargarita lithophora Alchichica-D10]|uniref:Cobalt-precorrin-6x reductase n=1 Tax=Gloeomargarita lithophora Alchichica-D10 TaxID=1188229 RepID=A0A1J0AGU1_9CYAN|nr:precorrin-6A reductase [Gloeomargarita lithophora]APB35164.1 cobalt-precorrin-6x reductase [Gloeomargarita lithophora Alchichica-D10]
MTLWLIGGTRESAELAPHLPNNCVITVTTERAKNLYTQTDCPVVVTRFTRENIGAFIENYHITKILDVSHPHAVQISQLAIECSGQYNLAYLRYERPQIITRISNCFYWQNLTELLTSDQFNQCYPQRILITLGYRQLPILKNFWGKHTWFVRIIPDPIALSAALETGFSPQNILALWPPVALDLERAIWQNWGITQVIAKASGAPGGEDVKQQLAEELGVVLHLLKRPGMTYPQSTDDLRVALIFAQG